MRADLQNKKDSRREMRLTNAKALFISDCMKKDNITYEECIEKIDGADPVYSLGWKMQIYMIDSISTANLKMKKRKKEFLESLTPEETEIYNSEVVGMPLKQMFKSEMKKRGL